MGKKNTPFQRGHEAQYGLKVTERDSRTGAVQAATCCFCIAFGREEVPGAKRKRTTHKQVFTLPFRSDSYTRHHKSAHAVKWAEYQALSDDMKATFFDIPVKHASTMLAHFESSETLVLSFNRDVVEVMIGDLLFDVDDDSVAPTRARALSAFKLHSDVAPDCNEGVYHVKLNSVRRFKLVLGFVSKGASFRSAARFVEVTREVTKLSYLRGCSEGVCAFYVRIICATSLQAIFQLLRHCWAYSIALDVGHSQGTSYMDVRIRFCTHSGSMANVHLIALPLHVNKTAAVQFDTAVKALDAVDPHWRRKMVSIGTDGEHTMTGRLSGVQTLFERAAEYPITRIWCGVHQCDLVAQTEYQSLADDTFVTTLTGLIAYLRRQQNLQSEMKTMCPKFVSTRWLSMKRVTQWLVTHRAKIVEYLDAKDPACKPSLSWWITLVCLDAVAGILAGTYSRLQGLSTLLSQQYAQFEQLCAELSEGCTVTGPLSEEDIAALPLVVPHLRRGQYVVAYGDARAFIHDQGTFVIDSIAKLEPAVGDAVVHSIANLIVGLYTGIKAILPVRHSNNVGSAKPLPPVLPHSLVKHRTAQICELLRGYRSRLASAGWATEQIDHIETDHRELLQAYRNEPPFKKAVDACSDAKTGFSEAWDLCLGRFRYLRHFVGGLASMFPNTATVESDFSLIGFEKNVYRQSLTDFSLEGILHAKQFDTLRALSAN